MRIHLDGDLLVYRCGFAAEKGEYTLSYGWGDESVEVYTYKKDLTKRLEVLGNPPHSIEFARRPEPVENALHLVSIVIDKIKEELQSDDLTVYLSGDSNFRLALGTIRPYKGNRDQAHKPVHAEAIKDLLRNKYKAIVSVDEEADDVIGYSHYAMWEKDKESSVICSTDKDLDMIPGLHYNFVKKVSYYVGEQEANYNFYRQMLIGDSVDNIVGVPGIGPQIATRLLEGKDEKEMYRTIRAAYSEAAGELGKGDKMLTENMQLLWIRRHSGEQARCPT